MLEIIRGLKAVQQQLDALIAQLTSLVPEHGDRLAEMSHALAQTPISIAESRSVNAYEPLLPGVWFGFAKKAAVQVCQHKQADVGNEDRGFVLTVSTGPEFPSNWLTLEFALPRAEIVLKNAISIEAQISSSVSGTLRVAVKAHGRDVEPKFAELAKYEMESRALYVSDLLPLGRSVAGLSEELDDVRIMIFLPPEANATFTFSVLRLALL